MLTESEQLAAESQCQRDKDVDERLDKLETMIKRIIKELFLEIIEGSDYKKLEENEQDE